VEQACGQGRIARSEVVDLSPVPLGDDPLSQREFRVKALATAIDGNVSLLAGLLQHASVETESIVAGLLINHQRGKRKGFGTAEGMLQSKAAKGWFTETYSLEKTFAATSLESYAACPYRFLAERVLKLHQLEDLTLALDFRERGSLAHEILALFHRNVNEKAGHPLSPCEMDDEQFDSLLSDAFEQALGPRGEGLRASLREIDRRTLLKWAADYRQQHATYDALWRDFEKPMTPEMFEVSFGRRDKDDAPPSTERPLELAIGDRVVKFSGRIDRIDTGSVAGRNVFNVLDYKTGSSVSFTHEKVIAGTALQLPLYALAVAELLMPEREPAAWQAAYWYLAKGGFKPKQALSMHGLEGEKLEPDAAWEETRELLGQTVAALVDGIRRAEFPVYNADEKCTSFCPFSTICRINHIRSLEKTWQTADPS
jgi:ATP-dependent helicase/nuclease subunit B